MTLTELCLSQSRLELFELRLVFLFTLVGNWLSDRVAEHLTPSRMCSDRVKQCVCV